MITFGRRGRRGALRGDVDLFVAALGAREGDPRLDRVLDLIGGEPEVDVYADTGVEEKYLVLADRGGDLLLRDSVVVAAFLYAGATQDHGPYPRWSSLVEGVGADATRADVERVLGPPRRSTSRYVTYDAGPGFVQFDFEGDVLAMIVVMSELVGGDSPADPPATEPPPAPFDGELTVFLDALGAAMFSPQHLAVIALAGPAVESHDVDGPPGSAWALDVFADTGVTLQFRDELLVAVRIALEDEDGTPGYPLPDRLIEGLALPATRAEVTARFGTARSATEGMDLFALGDRYLRFDFVGGRTVSVSVVRPAAD